MTRVNADVPPKLLADQHLMAEWREIKMVPAALRRSLLTKSVSEVMREIPPQFTLNKGHVKFFYNKMEFLERRYAELTAELKSRGYELDPAKTLRTDDIPYVFFKDAYFDSTDRSVIAERIVERIKLKPTWYKMNNQNFDLARYEQKIVQYVESRMI